ncbi:tyrosine-type recombinase/integrase [Novosphingobium resinovorum]
MRTQDVPQKQVVRRGLARQSQSQHHPAVPFRQVPLFMHDLLGGTESSGRLALAFAALTASRSGEVRQATWDQIDLDTKIWSKPAHIMKSRRASSVPLSEAALVILRRAAVLRGKSHVVFPGRSGALLNNGALRDSMLAQGWGHATVHGLRSSFRDWAAEEMPAIPAMVAELILSHSVLSQTERAYLRSDLTAMRRTLMEAWAAFIMPQPEKPASGASAPCSGPLTIDR